MPRGECSTLACGGTAASGDIYCQSCKRWTWYAGMNRGERLAVTFKGR